MVQQMENEQGSGTPVLGVYGQELVDYRSFYTKVVEMVEQYNQTNDLAFIARAQEDGTQLKIRHWERSFEMTQIPDGWEPDSQRLGFWGVDVPLNNYGAGYKFTFFGWQDLSLREAEQTTADLFRADLRLQAKLLYNTMTYGGPAYGAGLGNAGVSRFSGFWNGAAPNGSGLTPPPYKAVTFADTHSHYQPTANAAQVTIADLNFLFETIVEHGYSEGGTGEGGDGLVLSMPLSVATQLKDLAAFTTMMTPVPFIGAVTQGLTSGFQLQGFGVFYDNWVAGNRLVGWSNERPVAYRRVPPRPEGQGLQFKKGNDSDNPLLGSAFYRRAGHMIQEKGAGAVLQIAGAYANPQASSPNPYSFEEVA